MAATLNQNPAYPIKGQTVLVTFSGLDSETNSISLLPTAAPDGSAIKKKLDTAKGLRVREYSGPSDKPWQFTPDLGGVYTFILEETTEQPSSGDLFEGSAGGAPLPVITQTGSVSIYVGQRMAYQIRTNTEEARIIVWVWNDTIRRTTIGEQGEASPFLDVSRSSQTAKNAASDPTVLAALEGLIDKTSSLAIGDLEAMFDDTSSALVLHMSDAVTTRHFNQDDQNGSGSFGAELDGNVLAVNYLRQSITNHMGDKPGADGGVLAPYHANPDTGNPLCCPNANRSSLMTAMSDLFITGIKHMQTELIHQANPVGTVPSYTTPICDVIIAFIRSVSRVAPIVPPATNQAAAYLSQLAGFKES